jgi:hypothetical protein
MHISSENHEESGLDGLDLDLWTIWHKSSVSYILGEVGWLQKVTILRPIYFTHA